MSEPAEARALNALWRNHPLTPVKDRWGERAHGLAKQNRAMLLAWAAEQPDYRLRDCRNIGITTLAWIRANQPSATPEPPLDRAALVAAVDGLRLPDEDPEDGRERAYRDGWDESLDSVIALLHRETGR